ncbi:MAG: hypothetical protein ACK413_01865 [Patescibacteria group bacterium]
MKIGILGYGEIGQSLAKFYQNKKKYTLLLKDLKFDQFGNQKLDILNVCIPQVKNFVKIVTEVIMKNKPSLTIIHSTVLPGTTKKIIKMTRARVVHSPIRGIHPKLYQGIKTFVKFIGCENLKIGKIAKKHFQEIGIKKVKIIKPAVATELNKLIDTTYYAHCIVFTDYVEKIFKKFKVPFKTFRDFNLSYNEGYKKLGKPNVIRPTLYPPSKTGGKITGHCLIPNAEILEKIFPHSITKEILKYK